MEDKPPVWLFFVWGNVLLFKDAMVVNIMIVQLFPGLQVSLNSLRDGRFYSSPAQWGGAGVVYYTTLMQLVQWPYQFFIATPFKKAATYHHSCLIPSLGNQIMAIDKGITNNIIIVLLHHWRNQDQLGLVGNIHFKNTCSARRTISYGCSSKSINKTQWECSHQTINNMYNPGKSLARQRNKTVFGIYRVSGDRVQFLL